MVLVSHCGSVSERESQSGPSSVEQGLVSPPAVQVVLVRVMQTSPLPQSAVVSQTAGSASWQDLYAEALHSVTGQSSPSAQGAVAQSVWDSTQIFVPGQSLSVSHSFWPIANANEAEPVSNKMEVSIVKVCRFMA